MKTPKLRRRTASAVRVQRVVGHHVTIGPFDLAKHPSGCWWLSKKGGEGMETSEKKLLRLLRDFWRKEF